MRRKRGIPAGRAGFVQTLYHYPLNEDTAEGNGYVFKDVGWCLRKVEWHAGQENLPWTRVTAISSTPHASPLESGPRQHEISAADVS